MKQKSSNWLTSYNPPPPPFCHVNDVFKLKINKLILVSSADTQCFRATTDTNYSDVVWQGVNVSRETEVQCSTKLQPKALYWFVETFRRHSDNIWYLSETFKAQDKPRDKAVCWPSEHTTYNHPNSSAIKHKKGGYLQLWDTKSLMMWLRTFWWRL